MRWVSSGCGCHKRCDDARVVVYIMYIFVIALIALQHVLCHSLFEDKYTSVFFGPPLRRMLCNRCRTKLRGVRSSWCSSRLARSGPSRGFLSLFIPAGPPNFYGVIVNPSIFNFSGFIKIQVVSVPMRQVFFKNQRLSTVKKIGDFDLST